MRFGELSPVSITALKSLARPVQYDDNIRATEMYAIEPSVDLFLTSILRFPTRAQVSASNAARLAELSSTKHIFTSIDSKQDSTNAKAFESLMAPESLTLMKGAQVMLVRNIDHSLVNGSIGTVVGFALSSSFPDRPKGTKPGRHGFSTLWPVVEFKISPGLKRTEILEPWKWEIQINKQVIASRIQVCLVVVIILNPNMCTPGSSYISLGDICSQISRSNSETRQG